MGKQVTMVAGRKNISWKKRALAAEKKAEETQKIYNKLLADLQKSFKPSELPEKINEIIDDNSQNNSSKKSQKVTTQPKVRPKIVHTSEEPEKIGENKPVSSSEKSEVSNRTQKASFSSSGPSVPLTQGASSESEADELLPATKNTQQEPENEELEEKEGDDGEESEEEKDELEFEENGVEDPEKKYKYRCGDCGAYFNELKEGKCPSCDILLSRNG